MLLDTKRFGEQDKERFEEWLVNTDQAFTDWIFQAHALKPSSKYTGALKLKIVFIERIESVYKNFSQKRPWRCSLDFSILRSI